MKKLFFIFLLAAGAAFQAKAQMKHVDLQMSVYTPHQNEVIPYGDTIPFKISVKNLGPDTLFASQDTIFFSVTGALPNVAFVKWANIAPMDTAIFTAFQFTNSKNHAENDTDNICLYFLPYSPTYVDTNQSNDTACVSFILRGGGIYTGITEVKSGAENLLLYPNPANQQVYLRFQLSRPQPVSVMVYDLLGREIWRKKYQLSGGDHKEELNISMLHQGVYFVKLKADNEVKVEKMIVN